MRTNQEAPVKDIDLGRVRRAALGVACAACCALPLLVVVGVISLGALVVGGTTVAGVVAVCSLAAAVATRRVGATPLPLRLAVVGAGAALAVVGLVVRSGGTTVTLVVSVALLSCAALLALAGSRAREASSS